MRIQSKQHGTSARVTNDRTRRPIRMLPGQSPRVNEILKRPASNTDVSANTPLLCPLWEHDESRRHETSARESMLYRRAAGDGPKFAPDIVREVLRRPGRPMPAGLRRDMEDRLGQGFADVCLHSDHRAAESADAVAAQAYTVGRHIVFGAGRYEPGSASGRMLITHELSHAAANPPGISVPSGHLRISSPLESAERHAADVSEGVSSRLPVPIVQPGLFRQAASVVELTAASVNHTRVTVPPIVGLTFTARKTPANATGVSFSLVGNDASLTAGTMINSSSGAITVDPAQTGGSAHVEASQTTTAPDGSSTIQTFTVPFNFNAIPSGISSTSAITAAPDGFYGGDFTHTFLSPAGGQAALDRSHVNERFPGASGTTLTITGSFGPLTIHVNSPNLASAGWDLNSLGDMVAPDHVTWSDRTDVRPFVANASNPKPTDTLPQALTAPQEFRNLSFPNQVYGTTAVASTTHRRALEERNNQLTAVTSANATGVNEEVVEVYRGPTVFRRCSANPASVRMSLPTPPGGSPPAVDITTITVDVEGQDADPRFSIQGDALGSTITQSGDFTPGMTAGNVVVRAGSSTNFDEVTVTIEPRPQQFVRLDQDRTADQVIQDQNLSRQGVDVAALERLNPELQSSGTIPAGTVVWTTARDVPANATGFEEIAERYFGSRHRWPRLWSFNPQIQDPSSITPETRIHLQSAVDRARFGEIPLNS